MNQNQEDPKNCYLISSNTFTKEEIHQDTLDTWNKYLNNDDMSDNFKTIIKELFIPYKISPLKFNLNHEYNKTPSYLQSSFDQYLYIAPSLKRLKQIDLYNKADLKSNGIAGAKPVKRDAGCGQAAFAVGAEAECQGPGESRAAQPRHGAEHGCQ